MINDKSRYTPWKILLILSLLIGPIYLLNASTNSIVVSYIEGRRAYFYPNPQAPKPKRFRVKKGMKLSKNAIVETKKGARLELSLPDSSIVRIAPNTRLKLVKLNTGASNSTELELQAGRVWSKVKKAIGKKPSFSVKTKNAVAGVRGTVFGVDYDENKASSSVSVYEGRVSVRPVYATKDANINDYLKGNLKKRKKVAGPKKISKKKFEEFLLSRLQQIKIGKKGEKVKAESIDPENVDEWTKWNQKRDSLD